MEDYLVSRRAGYAIVNHKDNPQVQIFVSYPLPGRTIVTAFYFQSGGDVFALPRLQFDGEPRGKDTILALAEAYIRLCSSFIFGEVE